ncbi:DUF5682 family protein [Streptomyces hesseae]|uniref:DUF5682 family protein n=1 Tax=Streptomyces hesseae TaxID=3075519 RepID=A0ABU2SS64_9ACTN|nr:DUF5682 family protein [Streptomyces sp. DSM 40473]MDT0450675.1 DUF5682 family protein [Streptomyces sp. DSM 40473]
MTGTAAPAAPVLLGVRHHGPGSARAVRAALDRCRPTAVLIEGPPEADALAALAAEEDMRPPVALLAHVAGEPGRAAFWPFAGFSPEWTALRWALAHDVPVRFIDLPAAHTLALGGEETTPGPEVAATPRTDPLAVLAGAAGYDDPETWWEDVVEHRRGEGDPLAPFEAVAEAMGELRSALGEEGDAAQAQRDAIREAHMRLRLREARREFGDTVAVVCGAWHVPALAERQTVAADRQTLKGLPKAKVEIGWVPWTHRRLSRHSGYGAGVTSPGWYGHLFRSPDRPVERWMTDVARLLRAEGHPVSSAHVIEAVRLAETLAAMRGRPLAGLAETVDAIRAVMCDGSDVPLALVRDRLIVGDVLGEVPDAAPASPLQRDLDRQRRTLRLKPEAGVRDCEFDLRKDTDAARSRLLHRLRLLGIDWGEPLPSRGGLGTFRESWRLCWEPELSVRLAEAGAWGTTVESAATAKAESLAREATTLAAITALAERCLLAGLPDALPVVMRALTDHAALDPDTAHLAQALPALVRSVRYGDVRRTNTAALAEVAAGLAERVFIGLPAACAGLDADAAAEMRGHVDGVHQAVALLAETAEAAETAETPDEPTTAARPSAPDGSGGAGRAREPASAVATPATPAALAAPPPGLRDRWAAVLKVLAERDGLPGGIRGRAARLLLDGGRLTHERAERLMGLVLSVGTPPAEAAAWVEGFVGSGGSGGMLLVHDERLLGLVDGWLTGVPPEAFTGVLPLLRRTFAAFEPAVRRTLGERIRRGGPGAGPQPPDHGAAPGFGPGLDPERAAAVLPVMRLLLGAEAVAGSAQPGGALV